MDPDNGRGVEGSGQQSGTVPGGFVPPPPPLDPSADAPVFSVNELTASPSFGTSQQDVYEEEQAVSFASPSNFAASSGSLTAPGQVSFAQPTPSQAGRNDPFSVVDSEADGSSVLASLRAASGVDDLPRLQQVAPEDIGPPSPVAPSTPDDSQLESPLTQGHAEFDNPYATADGTAGQGPIFESLRAAAGIDTLPQMLQVDVPPTGINPPRQDKPEVLATLRAAAGVDDLPEIQEDEPSSPVVDKGASTGVLASLRAAAGVDSLPEIEQLEDAPARIADRSLSDTTLARDVLQRGSIDFGGGIGDFSDLPVPRSGQPGEEPEQELEEALATDGFNKTTSSQEWLAPARAPEGEAVFFDTKVDDAEPLWQAFQTPGEAYRQLASEVQSPIELALLAKLRIWETGHAEYSLEETMELVRWLEAKLEGPANDTLFGLPRRGKWSCQVRMKVIISVVLIAFLLLILISTFTAAAIQANKSTQIRESGLLTVDEKPVGVAQAVRLHNILEYPNLQTEELRRVQDVVFMHQGDFHFHRVGGSAKLLDGSVRLAAEDGTLINIQDSEVVLSPRYAKGQVIHLDAAAQQYPSWTSAGTFRTLTFH